MKFRTVLTGELKNYLSSSEYLNTEVIPITPQRVISHSENPRAHQTDPALILAEEENGNVLGFIGLLPDLIFNPDSQKVFWISCWWIHPEKGKGLGVSLLFAAYQASNGKLIADSTPESLPIFKKSKLFIVPEPKQGLKIFLQPLLKDVVLRKKPGLKEFKPLLEIGDGLIKTLFSPITIYRSLKKLPPDVLLISDFSSKEIDSFVAPSNLFKRKSEEFKWVKNFPWLLQPEEYKEKRNYPFSSTSITFLSEQYVVQIKKEKVGFLFLTERNKVVKLCYSYINLSFKAAVVEVLIQLLYQKKAKEFICYDEELNKELIKTNIPFAIKYPTNYQYIWGKPLGSLPLQGFQYGDGDAIFT